jgi:hypothetical protein
MQFVVSYGHFFMGHPACCYQPCVIIDGDVGFLFFLVFLGVLELVDFDDVFFRGNPVGAV